MEMRYSLLPKFDIEGGPLAKAAVITTEKGVYLFVDVHHVIFDGHSRNVLVEDIDKAYAHREIEEERCTIFNLSEKGGYNAECENHSGRLKEMCLRCFPALTPDWRYSLICSAVPQYQNMGILRCQSQCAAKNMWSIAAL